MSTTIVRACGLVLMRLVSMRQAGGNASTKGGSASIEIPSFYFLDIDIYLMPCFKHYSTMEDKIPSAHVAKFD
ncbi:hypothetical protein [Paraburkholderia nodosa]|uniref:hypothetical protein n=1 Tax=Paraburkholderia nodosa TaxID=392320 RepID=UPI0012B6A10D|nr:hypothetical protein [Paraburkholderia nodosa]